MNANHVELDFDMMRDHQKSGDNRFLKTYKASFIHCVCVCV